LRYAPTLATRGARVTYRSSRKLNSLLGRVPSIDRVLPDDGSPPQADAYVLVGDLPRLLDDFAASPLPHAGATVAHTALPDARRAIRVFWPQPAPTLRIAPLPERLAEMRERLGAFGPPPYTGVTWRGGIAPDQQRTAAWVLHKKIDLPALASALDALPGTLIALQRAPEASEIESLSALLRRPVHDLTALNEDLEGMLALLSLLDEYVGVSNTNMHLRAIAGRTARVLVPAPAEWRWMRAHRSSPWFPGFSIYRQSLQGDWSAALSALKIELAANSPSKPCSNPH
jgi:hypothetical protein